MKVSNFDVCVPGYERLRTPLEIILTSPIGPESTAEEIRDGFLDCVRCICWEDAFIYDEAPKAVEDFYEKHLRPAFAVRPNPFHLEAALVDDEDPAGVLAFLYLELEG